LLIAEFGDQKCKLLLRGLRRFFSLRSNILGILVLITETSVLTKKPISVDKRDRKRRGRGEERKRRGEKCVKRLRGKKQKRKGR
jgi:hypothetical protein